MAKGKKKAKNKKEKDDFATKNGEGSHDKICTQTELLKNTDAHCKDQQNLLVSNDDSQCFEDAKDSFIVPEKCESVLVCEENVINSNSVKTNVEVVKKENFNGDEKVDLLYLAGGGKVTYHGTDYNLKLLMHFAWNMYLELKQNSSDIDARNEFRLGTEMKEAGKFDDVILRYKKNGLVKYRMLQAKHKQVLTKKNKIMRSELESVDKDFSLKMYCKSFIEVTNMNRFRDGEIQDTIICTNNIFDSEVTNKDSGEWTNAFELLQNFDPFFSESGKRYVFCKDVQKREPVFSMLEAHVKNFEKDPKTRAKKVNDFLDKLVLALEQPSVDQLTAELETKICDHFSDGVVYDKFYQFMSKWMNDYITEDKDIKSSFLTFSKLSVFFENAEGIVANLKLNYSFKNQVEKLAVKFESDNPVIIEAKTFVESKDKKVLLLREKNAILGLMKIRQCLKNESEDNCIFANTESLTKSKEIRNDVTKAFKIEGINFFVMVDDVGGSLSYKVMEIVNKCCNIMLKSKNKKVILILKPKNVNAVNELIEEDFADEKECFVEICDTTNSLNDFTLDSRQVFLDRKIMFQDIETKLGVLIENNTLEKQIKDDLLCKFLMNDKMEFGNRLKSLEEVEKFYIERTFNVPKTENTITSKSVREGIITEPKTAIEIKDYLFLISAEPGMGKSTLLTRLALDLKQQNPSWWIIRFNLSEYIDELEQWDEKDAHCFVFKAAKLHSELEKCIFETRLKDIGKMVILFDGFDEISPKYKEKVIKIIDGLKACKLEKLCITSRPHMKSFLESTLEVKAYTLKPFQESDRKEFLLKFWTERLGTISTDRIEKYIDCLLEVLSRSFRDSSFSGTPLHIRMLAEVFQDSVSEFIVSNAVEPLLPPRLNLLSLYEEFVNKTFKIYFEEKMKTALTNQASELPFQLFKEKMEEKFEYYALAGTLFPKEAHYWMDKKEDNTSAESIVRVGIVNRIDNDRTEFIHRTFAEYFAALWFACETNWRKPKVNRFVKNSIFSFENVTIRTFLDYVLADQEIHVAILNRDSLSVLDLLEQDTGIIANRDRACRTPLHLACAYGYKEIVKMLLEKGANAGVTDELFGWSPLAYAATVGSWDVTKAILIEKGMFSEIIGDDIESYGSTELSSLLHAAAKNGNLKFVQLLIKEKVSVNMKDENDKTILHAAAKHFDIINYFLSIIDDDDDEMMNSRDAFGKTPLHAAVEYCNFDAIKLFVERGANVSATDNYGRSLMHMAARTCDLHTMMYLFEHKANIFVLDENKRTPLHYVENDEIKKIKFLIDNVNHEERRKFLCTKDNYALTGCQTVFQNISMGGYNEQIVDTYVHWIKEHIKQYEELRDVCDDRHEDPVTYRVRDKLVTEKRQNFVYKTDDIGDTNLFFAVKKNDWDTLNNWRKDSDPKTVRQLLRSTDVDGKTMLHYAFANYNFEIVYFLLTESDIQARDKLGKTPLHVAAIQSNLDPIKHLIEYVKLDCTNNLDDYILALDNNKSTPIHDAVYEGNLETMKYLIENLSNEKQNKVTSSQNKYDRTLIHLAFCNYRKEIVDWLLNLGADIFVRDKDSKTVLHYAVFTENPEAVKYILTYVKNINPKKVEKMIFQQDQHYDSPFHIAIYRGLLNIIQYFEEVLETKKLQEYVQSRFHFGRSVLHSAFNSKTYNRDLVDWLIKTGADIFCKDQSDQTPLIAAVKETNLIAISHLIEHIKKFGQETLEEQILRFTSTGHSPLLLSLEYRKPEIYYYLHKCMQRESFVKMVKSDKYTSRKLLFHSAYINEMRIFHQLITEGVDVFLKSNENETILHCAVQCKNFDAIKVVIEHIKQNSQETLDEFILSELKDNRSAFHSAIDNSQPEIAKYLARNVTEINRRILMKCQCTDGSTPLHLAIKGKSSEQFIEWLISEGANIFAEDNEHQTVLHLAVVNKELFAFFLNLLKSKGDRYLRHLILKQNDDSYTVLHSFLSRLNFYKDIDDTKMIIIFEGFLDDATIKDIIDIRNDKKVTALYYAALSNLIASVKWLLCKGASFLIANHRDMTPLHIAALNGNTDVVRFIVEFVKENHPDTLENLMFARDDSGFTPFMSAISDSKWNVARYLAESISSESANRLFVTPDNKNRFPIHLIFEKFGEYLAEWSLKTEIHVKDSMDRTVLHSAVTHGELVAVKFFIENIKKVDKLALDWFVLSKDTEGDTPMHLAIVNNRVDIVEYVFANISESTLKTLVDSRNKQGKTILHLALENSNKEVVAYIIQAGADISCKDDLNNTCLHMAFYNSNRECGAYFLEYFKFNVHDWKQWVHAKNLDGNTALHMAASLKNFRNFQHLLKGLNAEEFIQLINDRNHEGKNSLFLAVANSDMVFTEYLLNSGADAFVKDSKNTTILHEVKNTPLTTLLIDHIVRERGCDALVDLILTQNDQGYNVFHQFFIDNRTGVKLLVKGLNVDTVKMIVNSRCSNGMTALHMSVGLACAMYFYYDVHKWLLEKGVDVFAKDSSGKTALHIAARQKNYQPVIKLLNYVRASAPDRYQEFAFEEDNEGNNVVKIAFEFDHFETIALLVETLKGPGLEVILNTINSHKKSFLRRVFVEFDRSEADWIIEKGVSIFTKDSDNETLLHTSAWNQSIKGVEYLIERIGNSVNFTELLVTKSYTNGCTALHYAVFKRNYHIVKSLIENTDQSRVLDLVNCVNYKGRSTLHFAIMKFHARIVDLLLKMGADYCCKDKKGRTILHYVVDKRLPHEMQELVEFLDHTESEAFTKLAYLSDDCCKIAFHEAVLNCQYDIANFFIERMDSTMLRKFMNPLSGELIFMNV